MKALAGVLRLLRGIPPEERGMLAQLAAAKTIAINVASEILEHRLPH